MNGKMKPHQFKKRRNIHYCLKYAPILKNFCIIACSVQHFTVHFLTCTPSLNRDILSPYQAASPSPRQGEGPKRGTPDHPTADSRAAADVLRITPLPVCLHGGSSPPKTGPEVHPQLAYLCVHEPSHEEPRCAQHPGSFLLLIPALWNHP